MVTYTLVVCSAVNGNGIQFTDDLEKLLLDYIFEQWTLEDPPKGSDLYDESDTDNVRFRVGIPDFKSSYEIACLQTTTQTIPVEIGKSRVDYQTNIDIIIRMKRLNRASDAGIDPQLGNMEREVQRILRHYRPHTIDGIMDIFSGAQDRIYDASDTWAKSDWRSIIHAVAWYQKVPVVS